MATAGRTTKMLLLHAALLFDVTLLGQAPSLPDQPSTADSFVIRNAHIVQSADRHLDSGDVLVEDGLITAVGRDIPVPDSVRTIDGTRWHVYPGFVAGMATLPTGENVTPDSRPSEHSLVPGGGSNSDAGIHVGITPEKVFDPSSRQVEALRRNGFTVVHLGLSGGAIAGETAVVVLDGSVYETAVLRSDVGVSASLRDTTNVFPRSTMGIFALWRNIAANVGLHTAPLASVATESSGRTATARDSTLDMLLPVFEQERPIFVEAPDLRSYTQLQRLARELTVISAAYGIPFHAGLLDTLSMLAESSQPHPWLFVSLTQSTRAGDNATPAVAHSGLGDHPVADSLISASMADQPSRSEAERRPETARQLAAFARRMGKRDSFAGFSVEGRVEDDLLDRLKGMVQAGLSESFVLRGLTQRPASTLGIDDTVGTVEAGKVANLLLATGPIFAEETRIARVFVRGHEFSFEPDSNEAAFPAALEALASQSSHPVGTWRYTISGPGGEISGRFVVFSPAEGGLSGRIMAGSTETYSPMTSVTEVEGMLRFEAVMPTSSGPVSLRFEGSQSGPELAGSVEIGRFGAFPFTASRIGGSP